MPTTDPANCIMLAQSRLRTTLANSASFRTWTGTATPTLALARIYHEALPPPAAGGEYTLAEMTAYRPYAIIWTDPEAGFRKTAISVSTTGNEFDEAGRMGVQLAQTVAAGDIGNPSEIAIKFMNAVGGILSDICILAGQAGYLTITDVMIDEGPYLNDPDAQSVEGVVVGLTLGVQWRN